MALDASAIVAALLKRKPVWQLGSTHPCNRLLSSDRDDRYRSILRLTVPLREYLHRAADRSWRVGSIQGESHGIPYVIQAVYDERYEVIETGLNGALGLIKSYHPIRLNQVRRSISEIWVRPLPHRAEIRPSEWACVLEGRFVATFPFEAVAASIIFNGTYARIGRLPLTLRPGDLHRITRICWQAERDFGRRLPSAEAVVERAEEALAAMNEMLPLIDRREVKFRTRVMELEALNLPGFVERFARRVLERRYGYDSDP